MSALVLWATLLAGAAVDAREGAQPAVMVVRSPRGEVTASRGSAVVELTRAWLRKRTDLELMSPEQAGLDELALGRCPPERLFSCVVAACPPNAKVIFFASLQPIDKARDELSVFVLDLEQTRARGARDDDALYSGAHVVRTPLPIGDIDVLGTALDESLGPWLQERGHLEPYGTITFEGLRAGRALVTLEGDPTTFVLDDVDRRLTGVRPGARAVTIEQEGLRGRADVEVTAAAEAVARVVPVEPGAVDWRPWLGLGLTAAGTAVTAVALGLRSGAEREACVRPIDGPSCATSAVDTARLGVAVGAGVTALGLGVLGSTLVETEPSAWSIGAAVLLGALATSLVITLEL